MEIVSALLGHSSMKVTQDSYGKIVEKKISEEMERLKSNKINSHLRNSRFFVSKIHKK
jgi:hypothetical protein